MKEYLPLIGSLIAGGLVPILTVLLSRRSERKRLEQATTKSTWEMVIADSKTQKDDCLKQLGSEKLENHQLDLECELWQEKFYEMKESWFLARTEFQEKCLGLNQKIFELGMQQKEDREFASFQDTQIILKTAEIDRLERANRDLQKRINDTIFTG